MMQPPSVSVVTVALNAAETIGATLDSVRAQSYPRIHQIVIDGGSTDATAGVVASRGAVGTVCESGPDGGLYDAMNKGVVLAGGDLVLFLNADDVLLHPRVIELAVRAIGRADPDAGVYCGGVVWMHPETGAARVWHHGRVTPCSLYRSSVPHQGAFFRRGVFDRVGGFDTGFRIVADYEWCLRALLRHGCGFEPIGTVVSVFTDGGVSSDPANKAEQQRERARARSMHFGRAASARCRAAIRLRKIIGR
jgi:glycosyltransferase